LGLEEIMSIALVDGEPDKQEIERLRQLLSRYDQEQLTSLFDLDGSSSIREVIAEALGISGEKFFGNDIIIHCDGSKCKIEVNPSDLTDNVNLAVKEARTPFNAYKAIGQVIHYIDRIDCRHDSILIDRGIDTNKVKAKLIIGRDGDERQVNALHNLNSHLNRIEIRTYDQLLKGARSHLADY
jgi:hypothetical protein